MHPTERLQNAPRCGAHSRRTGQPCRAPAIRDKQRCRMHGCKGSGAPLRNQNAVTSGNYTAKKRGQHLWATFLCWWVDRDNRRMRSRISSPMEVGALAGCLRAFKLTGWDDDVLQEFGLEPPESTTRGVTRRPAR